MSTLKKTAARGKSVKKIVRKPYTFRFDEKVIEGIRKIGVRERRDLTNQIEIILDNFVKNDQHS